jgi:hypothetical protein
MILLEFSNPVKVEAEVRRELNTKSSIRQFNFSSTSGFGGGKKGGMGALLGMALMMKGSMMAMGLAAIAGDFT